MWQDEIYKMKHDHQHKQGKNNPTATYGPLALLGLSLLQLGVYSPGEGVAILLNLMKGLHINFQ